MTVNYFVVVVACFIKLFYELQKHKSCVWCFHRVKLKPDSIKTRYRQQCGGGGGGGGGVYVCVGVKIET